MVMAPSVVDQQIMYKSVPLATNNPILKPNSIQNPPIVNDISDRLSVMKINT